MTPIVHNIDPFLIQFTESFGIRWYSLPYMLGMLFVYLSLRGAARSREIRNLTPEVAESFVLAAILAALIGARFFHVFVFEYSRYGLNPLAWIAVWRGGLAFHGGLAGVLVVIVWFTRKHGLTLYRFTDQLAIPIALALAFGRIANFINAEMYGTPYEGMFCVDYSQNEHMANPPAGCRHPTQLYESAKNFGMAGLFWATRRWFPLPPGVITWGFFAYYGWIRFGLMYLRVEERVWAGLTLSQIFSAGMGVLGVVMIAVVVIRRSGTGREASPA